MDKLVRKIEVPLAKKAIENAGLYIVQKKDLTRLAEVAADAYRDYPLHNWLTKGKYDEKASKLLMLISLQTMTEDAVIYADSEEINGFAAWLPFGFTGNKALHTTGTLLIFVDNSHIADERIGLHHNLTCVAGVSQGFYIAHHAGIEHQFAHGVVHGAETHALKHLAVLEH